MFHFHRSKVGLYVYCLSAHSLYSSSWYLWGVLFNNFHIPDSCSLSEILSAMNLKSSLPFACHVLGQAAPPLGSIYNTPSAPSIGSQLLKDAHPNDLCIFFHHGTDCLSLQKKKLLIRRFFFLLYFEHLKEGNYVKYLFMYLRPSIVPGTDSSKNVYCE